MKTIILGLAFFSLTGMLFAQKSGDYSKIPVLVREAKKKNDFRLADSLSQDYIENYLLKLREEELMTSENLSFISKNLSNTEGKAFQLFSKQSDRVNLVLGTDKAESALKNAISNQFLSTIEDSDPNWSMIEHKMRSKFGELGREIVYGKRMNYYIGIKDWTNFGKYYLLYFEKALKRPDYDVNDVTWFLFENVNSPKILSYACDVVMKYALEEWYSMDFNAYDTYANLLYKTGRIEQAIYWEEKAVKSSNRGKVFVETLDKMRKEKRTWAN